MDKLAVLITCHNRVKATLKCLECLYKNNLSSFELKVYLVDDGSTDNTGSKVKEKYPDINIIRGTGDLYWNNGMNLAWRVAVMSDEYDYFVWLNDDTYLYENGIEHLIECHLDLRAKNKPENIVAGCCENHKNSNICTYGGRNKNNNLIVPNGEIQECSYINGNIVLIPRIVFDKLGFLNDDYRHAYGDFDYSLMARKQNILCVVTKRYVAVCKANYSKKTWADPQKSFLERYNNFISPTGLCISDYIKYRKRFWIKYWLFFAAKAYTKLLFPKLYNIISK